MNAPNGRATSKARRRAAPPSDGWGAKLIAHRLQEVHSYFVRRAETDVALSRVVAAAAIVRASKLVLLAQEKVLSEVGLTMSRFEVLGLVSDRDLSLKDLTKGTLIHPATLTSTVDALEKQKLLRRRSTATDRRVTMVRITDRGRIVLDEAIQRLSTIEFGLGDLSESDAANVSVLLSRLEP